jgi:inorganic pyrophosphatase
MGEDDHKIVAVEHSDPRLSPINALGDVAPHRLREIETFFNTYKDLEGKQTEVIGWLDREDALRLVDECRRAYQAHQGRTASAD